MHADGVEILHRADGDRVAGVVAHDLELDLFPAVDVLFDQHLMYRREHETVVGDYVELGVVVGDAAARSAEGESGAYDYRVADVVSRPERVVVAVRYLGGDAGLPYFEHRLPEQLAVLRLFYRLGVGADEPDVLAAQEAGP